MTQHQMHQLSKKTKNSKRANTMKNKPLTIKFQMKIKLQLQLVLRQQHTLETPHLQVTAQLLQLQATDQQPPHQTTAMLLPQTDLLHHLHHMLAHLQRGVRRQEGRQIVLPPVIHTALLLRQEMQLQHRHMNIQLVVLETQLIHHPEQEPATPLMLQEITQGLLPPEVIH